MKISQMLAFIAAVIALTGPAVSSRADTNAITPPPPVSSNRFLFIVDTSSSMKGHMAEEAKMMAEILVSSANGQLRPGDTLGQWTYNSTVHANFPLKTWGDGPPEEIAWAFTNYLSRQKFEGSGKTDVMLKDMYGVMRTSDIITVIILHNGKLQIKGTPFDEEINAECEKGLKELGNKGLPVMLVLQTRDGEIKSYRMSFSPWPVAIPEIPPPAPAPAKPSDLEFPSQVAADEAVPVPPPPTKYLPSMILKGASPKTVEPSSPAPQSDTAQTIPNTNHFQVASLTPSNEPAQVPIPPPAPVSVAVRQNPPPAPKNPPSLTPAPVLAAVAQKSNTPPPLAADQSSMVPTSTPATTPLARFEPEPALLPPVDATGPAAEAEAMAVRFGVTPFSLLTFLACIVLMVLVLKLIRARQYSKPSLITRSMDDGRH